MPRSLSVCPVGAVSNTMRSYLSLSMCLMAELRAVASSMPGMPDNHSWNCLILSITWSPSPFSPASSPAISLAKADHLLSSACIVSVGSTCNRSTRKVFVDMTWLMA